MMALQAGIGEVPLELSVFPQPFISILMTRFGWKVYCPAPRQNRPYSSFGSLAACPGIFGAGGRIESS